MLPPVAPCAPPRSPDDRPDVGLFEQLLPSLRCIHAQWSEAAVPVEPLAYVLPTSRLDRVHASGPLRVGRSPTARRSRCRRPPPECPRGRTARRARRPPLRSEREPARGSMGGRTTRAKSEEPQTQMETRPSLEPRRGARCDPCSGRRLLPLVPQPGRSSERPYRPGDHPGPRREGL